MAMNQCCECDKWYNETENNPGSLCSDCKKKQLDEELKSMT